MPETPGLKLADFRTAAFKELEREAPRAFGAALNNGMRLIGAAYSRHFSNTQLTEAAGYKVKRKGRIKGNRRYQPKTSPKWRRAGLRAVLLGQGEIDEKRLILYTKNPLLIQRVEGDTVRAQTSKGLLIYQGEGGPVSSGSAGSPISVKAKRLDTFRRVREVRIDATIKFESDFAKWVNSGEATTIFAKAIDQGVARLERSKSKGRRLR